MDYFTLGIFFLSLLTIGIGLLFGFIRGFRRSLLRSIILIVCLIIAFVIKEKVVNIVENISIGDNTVSGVLEEALNGSELVSKLGDRITVLVSSLLGTIVYILSVLILELISLITVYPILKIFVKKPKDKAKRKKGLGAILGGVMGLILCITVIGPISGLMSNVSSLSESLIEVVDGFPGDNSGETAEIGNGNIVTLYSEEEIDKKTDKDKLKDALSGIGITSYKDGFIGKTYNAIGGWYYNLVSSAKDKSGKKISLNTQIGAINGAIRLAGKVLEMKDLDFEQMFKEGSGDLTSVMKNLDDIKDGLSPDMKEMLNGIVQESASSLIESLGDEKLNIDFSDFNIMDVSFEKEAEIFQDFSKLNFDGGEGLSNEEISLVAKDLAESKILLKVIDMIPEEEKKFDIELTGEQVDAVNEGLEGIDIETANKIRALFNIT